MRPSILKTGQCTRYRLSIVWGKLWRLNPGAASYRASDLVPWHYPDGPAGTNNGDPYDTNLDRNAANFQPLTPLSFLARSAQVHPEQSAIIHGERSWSYREFFTRARQLASALVRRGIKRGDTVAVVLANTPAMLEAHYGVAMAGAVLNTINTRLDGATIAFTLDHGDAKVLIANREFSKVVNDALAACKGRPPSSITTILSSPAPGRGSAISNMRIF